LPLLGLVSFPFLFDAFPFSCSDIFVAVFFFFLACAGSSSTFEFFLFRPVVVEGRGEMGLLRPLRVLEVDARVVGIAGGLFSSVLVARMWEEEWLIIIIIIILILIIIVIVIVIRGCLGCGRPNSVESV
jgi:hypothetical protein